MSQTGTVVEPRKPLGVRATPEQHRMIAEAARLEHRSINTFVLRAALQAAEAVTAEASRPRRSRAEVEGIIRRAQDAVVRANPERRSMVDELIAERREAAGRGE